MTASARRASGPAGAPVDRVGARDGARDGQPLPRAPRPVARAAAAARAGAALRVAVPRRSVADGHQAPGALLAGPGTRSPATVHDRRREAERVGWEFCHSIIDDHSRLAYTELHADERPTPSPRSSSARWTFFAGHGIHAAAAADRQRLHLHPQPLPARTARQRGIQHRRIPPRTPKRNGKVERYQQTLAREWAYGQRYRSSTARAAALPIWLIHYNTTRHPQLNRQPAAHQPSFGRPEAQQLVARSEKALMDVSRASHGGGQACAPCCISPSPPRSPRSSPLLPPRMHFPCCASTRLARSRTSRRSAPRCACPAIAAGSGSRRAGSRRSSFPRIVRDRAPRRPGKDRKAPLLGMPADGDRVLYAPYNDKTLIRNVVAYRTACWMGRHAARTRFVRVRLNGRAHGVYVLMEKLELGDDRVRGEALFELTFRSRRGRRRRRSACPSRGARSSGRTLSAATSPGPAPSGSRRACAPPSGRCTARKLAAPPRRAGRDRLRPRQRAVQERGRVPREHLHGAGPRQAPPRPRLGLRHLDGQLGLRDAARGGRALARAAPRRPAKPTYWPRGRACAQGSSAAPSCPTSGAGRCSTGGSGPTRWPAAATRPSCGTCAAGSSAGSRGSTATSAGSECLGCAHRM